LNNFLLFIIILNMNGSGLDFNGMNLLREIMLLRRYIRLYLRLNSLEFYRKFNKNDFLLLSNYLNRNLFNNFNRYFFNDLNRDLFHNLNSCFFNYLNRYLFDSLDVNLFDDSNLLNYFYRNLY
jgi:hypothetical protein